MRWRIAPGGRHACIIAATASAIYTVAANGGLGCVRFVLVELAEFGDEVGD